MKMLLAIIALFCLSTYINAQTLPLYQYIPQNQQTKAEVDEYQALLVPWLTSIVVRFNPDALRAETITIPLPHGGVVKFNSKPKIEWTPIEFGSTIKKQTLDWRDGVKRLELVRYSADDSPMGYIWDGEAWYIIYFSPQCTLIRSGFVYPPQE